MVALILAAGYGTRMYPLTEKLPKALLAIGNTTILGELVAKLQPPEMEIQEIVLVANRRFAEAFRRWAEARGGASSTFLAAPAASPGKCRASTRPSPSAGRWAAERPGPIPCTVLDDGSTSDENRLGSVGDLAFAIRSKGLLKEDLLVLGSDNLFEEELAGFVRFARQGRAITLGAYELPDRSLARRYGVLSVGRDGRITAFAEKPQEPYSSWVSMAVYFFPGGTLARVLEYVSSVPTADTLGSFIAWLIAREQVFAYRFRGEWLDIGDIASYRRAQEIFHP